MLRKLLTRYLAVAAIACGLAAGNASAATYAIGDLTAAGTFSGGTPTIPVGSFSDSWTFTLSGGANTFAGLFTSVFTPMTGLFSPLSIILHGPGGAMPILAGRSARFSQPEIRIGIMPGIGGTQRLVRAVGKFNAMRMLLTGQPVDAEEARLMSLVSQVLPDEEVIPEALKMARLIAAMPPLAAQQIKEVMLAGVDASLEAALALERKANQLLFATRDQKEGMQAFLEKRRPKFDGA